MGESKTDDIKGRVKEATGVITGDEDLEQAEGKADQAAAKVKETAEKAKDKVEDAHQTQSRTSSRSSRWFAKNTR